MHILKRFESQFPFLRDIVGIALLDYVVYLLLLYHQSYVKVFYGVREGLFQMYFYTQND